MSQWRSTFSRARWVRTDSNIEETDWVAARAESLLPEHDLDYFDGDGTNRIYGGDQILHLMRAKLAGDSLLASAFGPNAERIEVMDYFPAYDVRAMPRLYLFHTALSENGVITMASDADLSISAALRWEVSLERPSPVPPGYPTVESLLNHVKLVIMGDHSVQVPVDGTGVPLFNRNPRFGPERARFDQIDIQGGVRYLATREITVVGSVTLDRDTRRINNIKAARGD